MIDHGPTPSPYNDHLAAGFADLERLRVRAAQLQAKHGLTVDEYASLFAAQGGRCAVCDQHETSQFRGRRRNLTVDKDNTGRVRGLLCDACHKRVRTFQSAASLAIWAQRALEYLDGDE